MNRCSGRVEVLHGDQWGTLCDLYFDMEDANVVCEHLQCGTVNSIPGGAHFGKGTGPVWKENFRCRGNETRLWDCPVSSWEQFSFSHENDASVICTDENWSLKLTNGGSWCDGRVEIYYTGSWGRLQDRHWTLNDANVVCTQLGCGEATATYNYSKDGKNGKDKTESCGQWKWVMCKKRDSEKCRALEMIQAAGGYTDGRGRA
ncbi:scavenger receptor cysteine-rich type 1 protein M130-like [Heterodontus francisci]|uniref:scavenger receptor cysteine-rich type 1 protein M130-like n=1 Tax=Heterodontus francisci TaxID=7792 RepID=UPI00355B5127